jgi:hypothetical protein
MRQHRSQLGLSDVTVNKAELIAKLEHNRALHHDIFEAALLAWKDAALAELDRFVDQVRLGRPMRIWSSLPVPEEHLDDYDRAIRMLRMHLDDTITLSEEAYNKLVEDTWDWRETFGANTASYLA